MARSGLGSAGRVEIHRLMRPAIHFNFDASGTRKQQDNLEEIKKQKKNVGGYLLELQTTTLSAIKNKSRKRMNIQQKLYKYF